MTSSKHDLAFVMGMKGPSLSPRDADKLLKNYLIYEARLSDSVRKAISTSKPLKPKGLLQQTILAYDKRNPPDIEKDGRKILEEVSDLMDELTERTNSLDELEAMLVKQVGLTAKGSEACKQANECLNYIREGRSRVEKSVKEIKVPRGDKPDVKQIYGATSAILAIALTVDVLVRGAKKWLG